MGVIRKTMSISTVGIIDFRSDKERIARSTRKTSKAAKEQTKLLQAQLDIQQHQMLQAQSASAIQHNATIIPSMQPVPVSMPPGWYEINGISRWWNGNEWLDHTARQIQG